MVLYVNLSVYNLQFFSLIISLSQNNIIIIIAVKIGILLRLDQN